MRARISVLCLLAAMFLATPAFAETTLKAQVDKTALSTDDTLTYKVTLASTDRNLPSPNLPDFKGFNILSQVQSSNMSFTKGEVKTTVAYEFILAPKQAGTITIGSATIKINNKIYSSESFQINATQGKTLPKSTQPESEEPQYTL